MNRKIKHRRKNVSRVAYFVALIVPVVFAAVSFLGPQETPRTESRNSLDFSLKDIDGKTFSLRDLRGRVVVMHLLVPNCPSCAAQNVELRKIASAYSRDKVSIVSISIDPNESERSLQDWRKQHQVSWPVARDTEGLIIKLGIRTSSTLFILDKDGSVQFRYEEVTSSRTIAQEIEKLL